MKRAFILAVALIYALAVPAGAFTAAGEEFAIPEIGLTCEIPDGFLGYTAETPPDDAVFDELGIDGYDEIDYIQDNEYCYLVAYSRDLWYLITVDALDWGFDIGYSDYTSEELEEERLGDVEMYESIGNEILDSGVYHSADGNVFLWYSAYNADGDYSFMEYTTLYDGCLYIFCYYNYYEMLTAADGEYILGVVNSTSFDMQLRRAHLDYDGQYGGREDDDLYEYGDTEPDYYSGNSLSDEVLYFLYRVEPFAYENLEWINALIGVFVLGALIYKVLRRRHKMKLGAAIAVSAVFFSLLALKNIGDYFWGQFSDVAVYLLISLILSIIFFAAIYFGRQKPAAKPAVGTYPAREDVRPPAAPPAVSFGPAGHRERAGRAKQSVYKAPGRRSPSDDTAWSESTFVCPGCGVTLLDGSEFCYKCNLPLSDRSNKLRMKDPWE